MFVFEKRKNLLSDRMEDTTQPYTTMSKGNNRPAPNNAPSKQQGKSSGGGRGNNPTAPGKTPPPAPKTK